MLLTLDAPGRVAGRVLSESGKATVSLGRIREVLAETVELEHANVDPAAVVDPENQPGELVVEKLSFAHGDSAPVLQDVSFRAAPGETVALVGPPGCGKSTILGLLLRLNDHEHGEIRIDGREIRTLPRKQARRLLAAVLQLL